MAGIRTVALALAFAASACGTVHRDVARLSEAPADTVLLVGKIEIVPPIKPDEQDIKTGIDPFGVKGCYVGRRSCS